MDETQVVEHLVLWLIQPQTRDQALLELSKRRETFPDLACYLWHSFGAIAVLLQEIAATYPMLSPPAVAAHVSNRVCNALALLQCVASHSATRIPFLQGEAGGGPGAVRSGNRTSQGRHSACVFSVNRI